MRENHHRVLWALYEHTAPRGEFCAHFATLSKAANMDVRETRRITRHLARKGLAEYHRALTTEDGEFAGAGYCITSAGQSAIEVCIMEASDARP